MKYVIFVILISTSLLFAQSEAIDSCVTEMAQDSICISNLVQRQIEKAREKQMQQAVIPVTEAAISIALKKVVIPISNDPIRNFVKSLPLHILIFITASFFIILGLVVRRTVYVIKKRSSRTLKNKISILREEKVITRENSKLKDERKKLKNHKSIFNASESHISNLAKELRIAKGELLLASRLKLFEIGKM
ncbi:hypothetical protein C0389_05365 [bacterium]|nr:hypothetical protein [bacterium]